MESTQKDTVRQYVQAFNAGDLDKVCSLFTLDAQIWGVLGWGDLSKSRPIWKDLIECHRMQLQIDGMIEEGSIVAVRFTEHGTSVKAFRGHGPTGKSYEIIAMEWFEFKGGKIHRRWGARDSAAISKQLGYNG